MALARPPPSDRRLCPTSTSSPRSCPSSRARSTPLPLLRDPDISYYLRQERNGFILGPYEWQATPMWLDGIPEQFANMLWADDLDRLETADPRRRRTRPDPRRGRHRASHQRAHPVRARRQPVHRSRARTAQLLPLQHLQLRHRPRWWRREGGRRVDHRRPAGVRSVVGRSAPLQGVRHVRLHRRQGGRGVPERVRDRLPVRGASRRSARVHLAAVRHARCEGRGLRRARRLGATGVRRHRRCRHRPHAHPVPDQRLAARRCSRGARRPQRRRTAGSPRLRQVRGHRSRSRELLDCLLCSKLPRVGRIGLVYALTPTGTVLSEFTVTRLGADSFYVVGAASAEWHDLDVLESALPSRVRRDDHQPNPRTGDARARPGHDPATCSARSPAPPLDNASFPWLSCREIDTAAGPVRALRVGYVGELGWELHAANDQLVELYELLSAAGRTARTCETSASTPSTACASTRATAPGKPTSRSASRRLDASLDRFVDFAKPHFVGREALLAERERGCPVQLRHAHAGSTWRSGRTRQRSVYSGDRTGRASSHPVDGASPSTPASLSPMSNDRSARPARRWTSRSSASVSLRPSARCAVRPRQQISPRLERPSEYFRTRRGVYGKQLRPDSRVPAVDLRTQLDPFQMKAGGVNVLAPPDRLISRDSGADCGLCRKSSYTCIPFRVIGVANGVEPVVERFHSSRSRR